MSLFTSHLALVHPNPQPLWPGWLGVSDADGNTSCKNNIETSHRICTTVFTGKGAEYSLLGMQCREIKSDCKRRRGSYLGEISTESRIIIG